MLLFPLGDVSAKDRVAAVNYLLIAANLAVFGWMLSLGEEGYIAAIRRWGLIPEGWTGRPETLLTSMFLHAGALHLVGNMLFLWTCGGGVEDRCGKPLYLGFYLAAGVAAVAVHIATSAGEDAKIPVVGASGAISGVMGGYLILFPRSHIRFYYWLFVIAGFFLVRSWIAIGLWFTLQLVFALVLVPTEAGGGGGVAYWAHIGGFVFGASAMLVLRLCGALRVQSAEVRRKQETLWEGRRD